MPETIISGYCYPPNSSSRKPAELVVFDSSYELVIDREVVKSGNIHDLKFSDRVGSINRKIFFDSGTQFETEDNETVDKLLAKTGHKNQASITVSKLESSWTISIAAIVCTALLVFGFFKYGLPAGAHYAAQKIPVSASEKLSEGTLELLSNFMFTESELPQAAQDKVTDRFTSYLSAIPDTGGFNYTLHFANMSGIANAFALPGGDIVVTDALVNLTTEKELDSVLFHEIGHVVERHGLEAVIKGSTTAVLVTIALGDLSTVAELTTGAATFFLQSSYTRNAESEADEYSFSRMEQLNIDPIHFANAMRKLSTQFGGKPEHDAKREYLSSHPSSADRIDKAIRRSEAFNQRS